MLETRRHEAEMHRKKTGSEGWDLLETERVRKENLNVADSKETSARLRLGERRRDGSRWYGQQRVYTRATVAPGADKVGKLIMTGERRRCELAPPLRVGSNKRAGA